MNGGESPDQTEELLQTYFSAASPVCQAVECARVRSVLASGSSKMLSDGGLLLAQLDDWEASFVGCPVTRLLLLVGRMTYEERRSVAAKLLDEWLEARPAGIREYVVVCVPAEDVHLIHALEQCGFGMLVPMVMLEGRADAVSEIEMDPVRNEDVPILAEIARRAFVDGRFRAEPGLPDDVVDEMYATWARNCCNKSLADEVFVARVAGRPVGFAAVRCGSLKVGEIVLIAVSSDVQGRGIGSALLETSRHWAGMRVKDMIAWTPLSNVPAIRMYERCSFRVGGSSLYYRLWREEHG